MRLRPGAARGVAAVKLRISDDLALPVEAVTEKLGFLGRTGSGKTYAAQRLAEEMHAAGAQFVVLDPVGVWYGLRLAGDGKTPGLPIPVLGGLRGDIPLEPGGGALIANLVVDRGISVVIDVSQFESDADKARFAQAFADRFFFRKKAAPSAVHLFIEECQEFVPQNPQREEARMLHAFTRMWKLGRNFGIGGSLLSQRPQEVNKKVLNLTELLFCFQLTGPQERKTIEGWISEKGIDEDIAAELPKLKVGHPHVWSPAWLRVSKEIAISRKTTFDASSTPTLGKTAAGRALSPIDLEQLRGEMAATIERAKAEDPRELRRQIAELQKEARQAKQHVPGPAPATKMREVPVIKAAEMKRLEAAIAAEARVAEKGLEANAKALACLKAMQTALEAFTRKPTAQQAVPLDVSSRHPLPRVTPERPWAPPPPRRRNLENGAPSDIGRGGLYRILVALAQRRQGLTNRQLGVRAGLSSRSGTFSTYISRARQAGWIEGTGIVRITDAGLRALGDFEPLPEGPALADYWLRELGGGGAARILKALIDVYPGALPHELLGQAADISPRSGTYSTYVSRLRTLELIEGRNELRASEELFA